MASRPQMLAVLAVVATAVLPFSMAEYYIVGDDSGWCPGFNYTSWAAGKEFRVGDKLVFMYIPGFHNVIEVGADAFKACNATGSNSPPLTTGNDLVPLETPGKRWYLCGKADHCERGQKLVIDVLAAPGPASPPNSPAPASPPPNSPAPVSPPPNSPAPASPPPASPVALPRATPPTTSPTQPPVSYSPSSPPSSPPSSSSSRTATRAYQTLMATMAAAAVVVA